jgi:hypothetical protein
VNRPTFGALATIPISLNHTSFTAVKVFGIALEVLTSHNSTTKAIGPHFRESAFLLLVWHVMRTADKAGKIWLYSSSRTISGRVGRGWTREDNAEPVARGGRTRHLCNALVRVEGRMKVLEGESVEWGDHVDDKRRVSMRLRYRRSDACGSIGVYSCIAKTN